MLNLSKKTTVIIGISIVLIGLMIFMKDYLEEKKLKAFDHMNNQLYTLSESEMPDHSEEAINEPEPEAAIEAAPAPAPIAKPSQAYYIGSLEIPKIGFKRGFVGVNSPDNHIQKNITVIKSSHYPDVEKGNFIIAGHSGSGPLAFFKELYRLGEGDVALVYYKNVKYTYRITKIYLQERIGQIAIYRDYSKNTLTLITCTKDNKSKQTVYIAELVARQSY